jgi:hypothetical protein
MRSVFVLLALAAATPAWADSFGGFSGVERVYMVGPDRACKPLAVEGTKATGVAKCEKVAVDVVARLSIKTPVAERGARARFTAASSGREVTVKRGDGVAVVTWSSLDPIVRVDAVYASTYEEMVALEIVVRRAGREATDVVGFDVLGSKKATTPATQPSTQPTQPAQPINEPPPLTPEMKKAIAKAKRARGAKAIAAWQAVLVLDADSSEGLAGLAIAQHKTKATDDALATLEKLALSSRGDAIEFLVAARFDKAFASLRADKRFRAAVGLDRGPTSTYERIMGFGGIWEQPGTSCDTAGVTVTFKRDRSFVIKVESVCSGSRDVFKTKGTWKVDTDTVVFTLSNKMRKLDDDTWRCPLQKKGDEEAIRCQIDRDLEFEVLPVRR